MGLSQNVKSQQDMVSGFQTSANILYGKLILRQPPFKLFLLVLFYNEFESAEPDIPILWKEWKYCHCPEYTHQANHNSNRESLF